MTGEWEFGHLGVPVRDVQKTMRAYADLGFQVGEIEELSIPAGGVQVDGAPSSTPISLRICVLNKGNLTIELIQPVAGDHVHSEFLRSVGEGANHVAFAVPDLRTEHAAMVASGHAFIFGNDDFAFFQTTNTGNMLIELNQKA